MVSGQDKVRFMRSLGVDAVIDASAPSSGVEGDHAIPSLHKAIKAVAPKGEVLRPVGQPGLVMSHLYCKSCSRSG